MILGESIWAQPRPKSPATRQLTKIRLGVLPIDDTILLHVAQRQGFFSQRGLSVELIRFNSALEKDAAAVTGHLDGHYGEISSAMVLRAQGHPYKVIATTSHTEPGARFFGLVTKPNSPVRSLFEGKGLSLGIARQTIVDFIADVFLEQANLPRNYFSRRDIRKISLRLQTLKAGQLDLSIFPEPMLSSAERDGGRIIHDDRALNMPLAVVSLKDKLVPTMGAPIRAALAEAVSYVNANPGLIRALMDELSLIPAYMGARWAPPTYNPDHIPNRLPDRKLYQAYVDWLIRNGVLRLPGEEPESLRVVPTFEETVDKILVNN
jgi:NitT/TauT family transport system substrate-binding protein